MNPADPTIAETLQSASRKLRDSSVPNDLLDAQALLAHALGKDRTYLIVNFSQTLAPNDLAKYQSLIERRAAGEPLQYITGRQEFFGLEFEVTPDVLIPRPETELIVEEVIRLSRNRSPVILDLCTGSGCIAVALAREIAGARVVACDISTAALQVAKRNAARYDLGLEFAASDLLKAFADQPFADFITCNPPYVIEAEVPALQREVRDWEPRIALTDAGDGLSFYRRLLVDAPLRLRPGGHLLCEMGYTQSEPIAAMVDETVWEAPRLLDDLQGIPRTLVLKRRYRIQENETTKKRRTRR
ncbi:MAG: peptide chain release factor N(5)-glutamine methyltransferase [Blastocatellia bacterium]